ncbi:hypothetical protein [Ramlibacter sp.]|uniref:hypothetical protein n=1 Tax=Ramlibacter sp. TaxID=1917967 RepID=UPI003D143C80
MNATLTAAPARAFDPSGRPPGWIAEQTVAFFSANPDEILTAEDIAAKFGGARSAAHTCLAQAVEAGQVKRERDKEGVYVYSRGDGAPAAAKRAHVASSLSVRSAREFTLAEKSLIAKVHGFMPAQQLLDILNDRLRSDLGDDARPYTMAQLQEIVDRVAPTAPAGGHDWASLRKLLAVAKRDGVLAKVTGQVIDDFAVVWGLNARQVMALKDTLLSDRGDEQ